MVHQLLPLSGANRASTLSIGSGSSLAVHLTRRVSATLKVSPPVGAFRVILAFPAGPVGSSLQPDRAAPSRRAADRETETRIPGLFITKRMQPHDTKGFSVDE